MIASNKLFNNDRIGKKRPQISYHRTVRYLKTMPHIVTLSGEPAGRFVNRFDEPLRLGPDSAVELLMLTVVQDDTIEIIQDANDRCSFLIGVEGGLAIVRPGEYSPSDFRRELEYQLNAVIPAGRRGSSWHVAINTNSSGDLIYQLRIETSFKNTPVDYNVLGSLCGSTAGSISRTSGGDGWFVEGSGVSNSAISRGRGGYAARLLASSPGNLPEIAVGLTNVTVPAEDNQLPKDFMLIGIRVSAGSSGGTARAYYFFNHVETAIDPGVWTPAINDVIVINRAGGNLTIQAARGSPSVTLLSVPYSTAEFPDYDVVFPAAYIYTTNSGLDTCVYTPDGDSVGDALGGSQGMRGDAQALLLSGYNVGPGHTGDAATLLNLSARSSTKFVTKFNPLTLASILGIPALVAGKQAQSYTFSSTSPTVEGAINQALEVRLRGLPISSRSGATRQTTATIACIPRLVAASGGQLRYVPGYSQPVSIPYRQPTALTSLEVEIVDADGVAAPLQGRTSLALRFMP